MEFMAFAVVLLPLLAATLGGLFGSIIGHNNVIRLTCTCVTISAIFSAILFVRIALQGTGAVEAVLQPWIATGNFDVSFGVMVDKLTATMLVVVTFVSAAVHYYSVGYMSHDESKWRFFSYLSLFTFTMLALVTAPNMLQMFLGWEGVGLASYLLIGFWYKKETANAAAMKAFLVNRVADLGLLLALFTAFAIFGTLTYSEIFARVGEVETQTFNFIGYEFPVLGLLAVFLFIGAMGKSAQFGFHTWLPDAMEGPTPVSALIHAATMVTAGVFLVARMSPIFEASGGVLTFVAWVGGITAIFAATIGLVQNDIKRVIAYSTCSQLGYMFFACGVSAYPAAIFHLTTHAFFKALLFLGAGSVIHSLADEQDMRRMGGLKSIMPITYALMWIGSLALAGIPPFAGFFSKDLILESTFMSGTETGHALYVLGTVAAFMTAFYSFRVLFMTFHGKPRGDEKVAKHAHESEGNMLLPMIFLGFGAVFSGFVLSGMGNLEWWQGAIYINEAIHPALKEAHNISPVLKYLPFVVVLLGIWVSYQFYVKHTKLPKKLAKSMDLMHKWLMNKWYIDELYDLIIVRPLKWLANILWQKGDVNGIDRFGPNGGAWLANRLGAAVRVLQTGYIYHYAFVLVLGVCVMITWLILK